MAVSPSQFDRDLLLTRLIGSRQSDHALQAATEWLAEEPENPRAHRWAAQALVQLDRCTEAETHLAKSLAANPQDAFAHRLMAIIQFERGNFRRADEAIHRAIELNPNDAQNWYQLAWMCHRQHDLKNGLKWATKARELAPNDADILNLYALCAEESDRSPDLLLAALAADPENAYAHNNLGVYYLDVAKDYSKAEECFRRALTIQPTLKPARRNLFLALKRRDLIYRLLRAPLDLLISFRRAVLGDGKRNIGAVLVGLVFWIFVARFFIIGLVLWFGLFWPMVKFYELLVIGDLRKRAGEIGATRGGVFGYRRWSLRTRLGVFAAGLIGFWTALYFLLWVPLSQPSAEEWRLGIVTALVLAVLLALLIYYGVHAGRKYVARYHAWQRQRKVKKFEES